MYCSFFITNYLLLILNICSNHSIPVGKNNRYGHPNKEVLENLENSKIYRTDQDGSIMFKIKNNKLKVETVIHRKEEYKIDVKN